MESKMISFTEIYKKYAPELLKYAYFLCRDGDEAKDIVSESFMKLWLVKEQVIDKTVKAYLFKIARNIYLKRLKNRKIYVGTEHIEQVQERSEIIFTSEKEENALLIAVKQLSEVEQTILHLRTEGALSYKEIAAILNLSVPAIKVKMHRLRLKVAQFIKEKELL